MSRPLDRREFLKDTLSAAGGAAALASRPRRVGRGAGGDRPPMGEWRNRQAGMKYRRLGRTGFMVSEIVQGGDPVSPDNRRPRRDGRRARAQLPRHRSGLRGRKERAGLRRGPAGRRTRQRLPHHQGERPRRGAQPGLPGDLRRADPGGAGVGPEGGGRGPAGARRHPALLHGQLLRRPAPGDRERRTLRRAGAAVPREDRRPRDLRGDHGPLGGGEPRSPEDRPRRHPDVPPRHVLVRRDPDPRDPRDLREAPRAGQGPRAGGLGPQRPGRRPARRDRQRRLLRGHGRLQRGEPRPRRARRWRRRRRRTSGSSP